MNFRESLEKITLKFQRYFGDIEGELWRNYGGRYKEILENFKEILKKKWKNFWK